MSFKIGFSVLDVPLLSSIEDYFVLAKDLHVDGIELVLGYKTYFSFDLLKALSKKYHVRIQSVHQPLLFILKSPKDEHPFQIAQYFRAKYVAHPLSGHSLGDAKTRTHFSWLRDMQTKYKTQILMENMPHEYSLPFLRSFITRNNSTNDLSQLRKVCEEFGFGFTLDTTHLAAKVPMKAKGFDDIQPYMQNIHVSDFMGVNVHLPLGTGDLNLKSFIKHLQKQKYTGLLTLEIFGEVGMNWINGKTLLFQNIRNSVHLIRTYSEGREAPRKHKKTSLLY